jgi:hypothetical protein
MATALGSSDPGTIQLHRLSTSPFAAIITTIYGPQIRLKKLYRFLSITLMVLDCIGMPTSVDEMTILSAGRTMRAET